MKKIFAFLILILCILSISVVAEQESLGTVKQGECIRLYQTCGSCSWINITSVISPINKTVLISNKEMTTSNSFEFNYSFCDTNSSGEYIVNLVGDVDGIATPVSYNFEVNDRGVPIRDNTTNIAIIITLLVFIIVGSFLTYYLEDALKLTFFLGTGLLAVFSLNILSNIAFDAGASMVVVNLLWFSYKIGLYIFWALFLVVLVKLTMELKIRKTKIPKTGSPLQNARENRLKRQGRWQ